MVSGGGGIAIASDELRAQVHRLHRLVDDLHGVRHQLAGLRARLSPADLRAADAPISALAAEQELERAASLVTSVALRTHGLVVALRAAITAYGAAERTAENLMQRASAAMGYGMGILAPLVMLQMLPVLGITAAAAVIASVAGAGRSTGSDSDGGSLLLSALGLWIRDNNELLTNPAVVALIRQAVMSSDDVVGGLARLPPGLAELLGDEGLHLTGLSTTAALLALVTHGLSTADAAVVRVRGGAGTRGTPAMSIADRAARIPRPTVAEPQQIRIDRYHRPGQSDSFEVYIAGTVDFGLMAGAEPWDMSSNVEGLSGLPAGSYLAVTEAMRAAGVTADSPVVLTGYSQGGLMAALVAASGDYRVEQVVTFGAPAGQVEIPRQVPQLAIRHSEDLVPALGGSDISDHTVVVERSLFDDRPVPSTEVVPAHEIRFYEETARLVDDADGPELLAVTERLRAFSDGATRVESRSYVASRVPVAAPVSAGGR